MRKLAKKISILLVAALLVMALVACGNKKEPEEVQEAVDTVEKDKTEEKSTEQETNTAKNEKPEQSQNQSQNQDQDLVSEIINQQRNLWEDALEFTILSGSKVRIKVQSEYLSTLDSVETDDGGIRALNLFGVYCYGEDNENIMNLDFMSNVWNVWTSNNAWMQGNTEIVSDTADLEVSILGVADTIKSIKNIEVRFMDWHKNPEEAEVLLNDYFPAEGLIKEALEPSILKVTYPQPDRVSFSFTRNGEINESIGGEYGYVGVALYKNAEDLQSYRPYIDGGVAFNHMDGADECYADFGAQKYTKLSDWEYELEWIDLSANNLRVSQTITDDTVKLVATMDEMQDYIKECTVYCVRDSHYNNIEIGYLKDVVREEDYGSFPAQFVDATDYQYGFVPHSDSYRLLTYTHKVRVPEMKWNKYPWSSYSYGCEDYSNHESDVKVVVFWNNDETGYSNMYVKVIFDNEMDCKDYHVGQYVSIMTAAEPDDKLITEEAYKEAIAKGARYALCELTGIEGNIAYYCSERRYDTAYLEEYSDVMEIKGLDIWHNVEYKKNDFAKQTCTLTVYDYVDYAEKKEDVEVTSYSSY